MNFATSLKTVYSKYADFSGRAQRSEFWWYTLFYVGIGLALDMVLPALGNIWTLANFVPQIAVTARRLHDTDRSGWWQLLPIAAAPVALLGIFAGGSDTMLIVAGMIAAALYVLLIVWFATRGTSGPNRFGEDLFGQSDASVFE